MKVLTQNGLKELMKLRHAVCYTVENNDDVIIININSAYIPKTHFQEMLITISQEIVRRGFKKVVFDMSLLQFYHEPTFDWFFTVWKERMFYHGVTCHRIILPKIQIIRDGVEQSRKKASEIFPHEKYWELEVQYAETAEDALNEFTLQGLQH
jgi:hypothetical protein